MACSRVRRLSDLLFVPPFPFQRVANLGKSCRLKERLEEDARLELIGSSTNPSSKPANVPPPPPPPPQPPLPHNGRADGFMSADSEVLEIGYEERPQCSLKFYPVDEAWRQRTC